VGALGQLPLNITNPQLSCIKKCSMAGSMTCL
jgi:hypothetical protein